ncbi:MAG TPA: hypothetical protein PKK96_16385 [Anaerolineales bacterium]|nr:hypothetical protein [Anaerolineales bacterium]HNQ95911.1 hypothetical protein [Anaerolineales bacterium]HNS62577.1 hypothetical protein [Anaerolineales bacterium]
MKQPTPTLRKLIARDPNFLYALALIGIPIIVLLYATIMSRGSFLPDDMPYLFFGVGTSVFGTVWLIYMHYLITTTFRYGMTVKGNIIRIERKTFRGQNGGISSTYYAIVSYSVNGEAFERPFTLPGNPEEHGLAKDMIVDLILREEKPKTAYIKQLYLD